MIDVTTSTKSYKQGDETLVGYLAQGQAPGPRPCVLVVHEWWGLDDYVRRRAEMLAELGYAALAVDMYGGGKTADNPQDAGALMNGVLSDIKTAEARLAAALAYLRAQPGVDPDRIAAIGYCFGGAMVLHAARIGMPLKGVVSFHGALGSFHKPAPGSVHAKVLVCHGAADSFIPADEIAALKQEMRDAKADFRFIDYPGAKHGFSNPEADERHDKFGIDLAYNADVDRQSWDEMKRFLDDIFA